MVRSGIAQSVTYDRRWHWIYVYENAEQCKGLLSLVSCHVLSDLKCRNLVVDEAQVTLATIATS